jgi:hypothetical protein
MSNRPRIRHKIVVQPREPRRYTGPFVYKYRTVARLDWLKPILLENTIYFPTAAELNDPEEARPRLAARSHESLIKVLVELDLKACPLLTDKEKKIRASEFTFMLRERTTHEVLQDAKIRLDRHLQRFRIYSLGKHWNNAHLWKEYAGNYTGYCLEFNNADPSSWRAYEVRYDDVALDITGPQRSEPYFLFYKNKQWAKEEEVRLLGQRDSDSKLTFEPKLLTRVILGRNIQRSHAATIHEWVALRELPLSIVSEDNL